MAGLSAARRLRRAGVDVAVVEARDRVGGRVLTVRDGFLPGPCELGAEFVHGQPPVLLDALREAGLRIGETPGGRLCLVGDRLVDGDEVFAPIFEAFDQPPEQDEPFETFANRQQATGRWTALQRAYALSFVEGYDAADPRTASLRSLIDENSASSPIDGERSWRVLDGYDRLPSALAEGLSEADGSLRLLTQVREVRWRRGQVECVLSPGAGGPQQLVRARMALVTLPLGVLKAPVRATSHVRFSPALPGPKREAIGRLGMGGVVKCVLRFRRPFWLDPHAVPRLGDRAGDLGFLLAARSAYEGRVSFPTWWTLRPLDAPVLVGWAAGPAATALASLSPRAALERATRSLAFVLGLEPSQVAAQVNGWRLANWLTDPFARGAYSFVPVGARDSGRQLAEPVEDTLFFAGEATDTNDQRGTVHGAMQSGLRAADEMLRALA